MPATPTPVNALLLTMISGTLLSHSSHNCVILRLSVTGRTAQPIF